MGRPPRIMLSAGEPSGDRLGAGLARALRERRPDIDLFGMGGARMAEAGVRLVRRFDDVSVVGLFEVLAHLPAIRRAMRELERCLEHERPDLLVPIDFPEFNLRLSGHAGRVGVPVVFYVSPQIWAWRPGRVHHIGKRVRRMLTLFPFETELYERAGVPVSFVGYPIESPVEVPERATLCAEAGLDASRRAVALMPGSRPAEIARQLPFMLDAAALLSRTHPDLQFLLPRAGVVGEDWLRREIGQRLPGMLIVSGNFPRILGACDVGVVAAGTASLEAAIVGLPIVVVYRMHPATYAIGRRLVGLENVALPNLVAGRRIVPELIQRDFTAENVARCLAHWLDDPAAAAETRSTLRGLRGLLAGSEAFGLAADRVLGELSSAPAMC